MKDCEWQQRVNTVMLNIKQTKMELKSMVEESHEYQNSNSFKQKLIKLLGHITQYNNMAAKIEDDADSTPVKLASSEKLRAKAIEFTQKAEDARDEQIDHAQPTDIGECNLILAGLKEIETTMTECNKAESKWARRDLEYAYWKALESQD